MHHGTLRRPAARRPPSSDPAGPLRLQGRQEQAYPHLSNISKKLEADSRAALGNAVRGRVLVEEIEILGPIRVLSPEGAVLKLPRGKGAALLAYLAAEAGDEGAIERVIETGARAGAGEGVPGRAAGAAVPSSRAGLRSGAGHSLHGLRLRSVAAERAAPSAVAGVRQRPEPPRLRDSCAGTPSSSCGAGGPAVNVSAAPGYDRVVGFARRTGT